MDSNKFRPKYGLTREMHENPYLNIRSSQKKYSENFSLAKDVIVNSLRASLKTQYTSLPIATGLETGRGFEGVKERFLEMALSDFLKNHLGS